MNNIFLIGMMGSGKSTTAAELAKILGTTSVDLDERVVDLAGKSINDIFAQDGEERFRDLETRVLEKTCKNRAQVIGTGGGVVIRPSNVRLMQESGRIIYLQTGFQVLWDRVKSKTDRPLLKVDSPEDAFMRLFQARTPLYEQTAEWRVATDHKTPKQVAQEIYDIFLK